MARQRDTVHAGRLRGIQKQVERPLPEACPDCAGMPSDFGFDVPISSFPQPPLVVRIPRTGIVDVIQSDLVELASFLTATLRAGRHQERKRPPVPVAGELPVDGRLRLSLRDAQNRNDKQLSPPSILRNSDISTAIVA